MIFDYRKTIQAINYFIHLQESDELNIMKVIKLLWIADRYHLRQYGRPITLDDYFALRHGPVASRTYDVLTRSTFFDEEEIIKYSSKFIKKSKYSIKSILKVDFDMMSETDRITIKKVSDEFGTKDKYVLRDYSHAFPEWSKFKEFLMGGISNQEPISYLDFFEGADDDFFDQNQDLIDLSKEIFIGNYPSRFVKS